MVDITRVLLRQNAEEFDAMIQAVAELSDEDCRRAIFERYDAKNIDQPHLFQGRKHGLFNQDTFHRIVCFRVWEILNDESIGLANDILNIIYEKLRLHSIVSLLNGEFFAIKPLAKHLFDSGNLRFYVTGLVDVADKMRKSVVQIEVENADGDLDSGSGVILRTGQVGYGIVLTNKHVLMNKKLHKVVNEAGEFRFLGDPVFDKNYDLAKFIVKLGGDVPQVNLAHDVRILDKIVSMGYPRIPNARDAILASHQGEVNGTVQTFSGENHYLISCYVSPGNSGGPIFNEFGFCSGLVTQTGMASYTDGLRSEVAYHMAIPENIIADFASANILPGI